MRRASKAILAGILTATLLGTGSPGAAEDSQADTPPAIVGLVLDTSGSVGERDLERTRDLALALLSELPAGSQVAVLTFDDQSRIVVPRTSQADDVRSALAAVKTAGHHTALYDALYDASRYLRDAPPARKAIVLVTDGKDENSALNLDDGLQVAKDSGIPIFAVGVGRIEERVLRRIAKLSVGEYLEMGAASGRDLAGRILALPTPPPAVAVATRPAADPPRVVVAAPPLSRGRKALWLVLLGGVFAAFALLLEALTRRGRTVAPSLSVAGAETPRAEGPQVLDDPLVEDDAYSPTVIARMDTTGEYLEKTITLSERPVLIVRGGPRNGQLYILNKETTTAMGRARANDIVLEDVAVSSQHCRIRYDGRGFVLHDLKSTNGTFVNDHRVTQQALKTGDVIKLGESELLFKLDQKKD